MTTYKVITTITWKFDSHKSHADCLKFAKSQVEKILDTKPKGKDFDGFDVQVDIAKMKERKRLVHLASFPLDAVIPHVCDGNNSKEFKAADKVYTVKMNSDRYHVFKANHKCVSCGLEGTQMILDMNPGDSSPHFNLYAEENGRLVLMTKDHILAKSKGGTDSLDNYQTMCATCNNLKGHYDLNLDNCRELRRIWDNGDKLPRKELRDLINSRREEMALTNAASAKEDTDDHNTGNPPACEQFGRAEEVVDRSGDACCGEENQG